MKANFWKAISGLGLVLLGGYLTNYGVLGIVTGVVIAILGAALVVKS